MKLCESCVFTPVCDSFRIYSDKREHFVKSGLTLDPTMYFKVFDGYHYFLVMFKISVAITLHYYW